MIEKLKRKDDRIFTAVGPKFDFGKVLTRSRRLLTSIAGRAAMRFPSWPSPTFEMTDDRTGALDETAFGLLEELFKELKKTYDASDHSVTLAVGPFYLCWAPFGLSALCGSVDDCTTVFDQPWSELDPTPSIIVRARLPPHEPLGRAETAFLAEVLRAEGDDIEPIYLPDDVDADGVIIRFPHDAFGAGRGRIRICRYAHKDADEIGGPT